MSEREGEKGPPKLPRAFASSHRVPKILTKIFCLHPLRFPGFEVAVLNKSFLQTPVFTFQLFGSFLLLYQIDKNLIFYKIQCTKEPNESWSYLVEEDKELNWLR